MALSIGTDAPDFTLPSTEGTPFSLSEDAAGIPCVLYFYPKDFTSVCTQEACAFRDHFAAFRDLGVPVFGISRDDLQTHERFKEQHGLPFALLSDEEGSVAGAYDALLPLIRVPRRITYLLDANHRIAAVYENFFGSDEHITAMREALDALMAKDTPAP